MLPPKQTEYKLITRRSSVIIGWERPTEDGISIATYNLYNLFDDDNLDLKLEKHARAIHDYLQEPDIIAIQEVENVSLLKALVKQKFIEVEYGVVLIEGPDKRGINVGLLYRKDRISVINTEVRQTCTDLVDNYGPENDLKFPCPDGKTPLFSRPPLIVHLKILNANIARNISDMWLIVNHFKSKMTYEPEHISTDPRRTSQAIFVRKLVKEIQKKDSNAKIVVLGDLNDFLDSLSLAPLTVDGMLIDMIKEVDQEERYTHVFNGVSQVLDHILISPSLIDSVRGIQIVHFNADFSTIVHGYDSKTGIRSSDHDVPIIVLNESRH